LTPKYLNALPPIEMGKKRGNVVEEMIIEDAK